MAKEDIRKMFGEYVTAEVTRQVLTTPDGSPRIVDATMLHVVTYNAHSIVESLASQGKTIDLSDLYAPLYDISQEHNGLYDMPFPTSQIGFGTHPLGEDPSHPQQAVQAALKMRDVINTLNASRIEQGQIPYDTSIVIQTGKVGIGNFGVTDKSMRYTHAGAPVSLCHDMAEFTRRDTCEVFIGEETMRRTQDLVATEESFAYKTEGDTNARMAYRVLGLK